MNSTAAERKKTGSFFLGCMPQGYITVIITLFDGELSDEFRIFGRD